MRTFLLHLILVTIVLTGVASDVVGGPEWPQDAAPSASNFRHEGRTGEKVRTTGEASLTLSVEGSETLVNLVRSKIEFLSFNRIRIRGEGVRRVLRTSDPGTEIKVEYDSARVDGAYDDEPYEFDFLRSSGLPIFEKDKLRQICWHLSMAGPHFTVGPHGEYASQDRNQEAWGEALDYVLRVPIRFPDGDLAEGSEWTAAWTGSRRQKDNGGRFAFEQKAKIGSIGSRGGRKLAQIEFSALGRLDIPPEKRRERADREESIFEAKGTAWFDLDRKIVVEARSAGSVTSSFAGSDPNTGERHELKIIAKAESSFSEP